MRTTVAVRFALDRLGRPYALAWRHLAMRWVRISYDRAVVMLASGEARRAQ
jgi:hypothetical protein